ncbi:unnamed protein product [Closterium sp. Yama58-4]|nr:unnamed protein product [Closterium sp. Yama58-4]
MLRLHSALFASVCGPTLKCVTLCATASAAPETSVAEAPQAEVEISVGAGDEDIESESEARPAPSRSKNLASVMAESQATATTRPRPPPVRVPDNPFVAMPVAGSSRDPTAPGEETHILISRAEFEALKKAQEASARTVARLEEELRSAKAVQARAPPRRPDEHVSGSGGASGRKRKRREELADEETSDEESEDEPPTKRGHLRVSKSPVLQRALNFLPANKSWKRACDLVKDYLFFEKENARITFYPSSDDKTVGVCAVIERLPFDFATLALAADKARRSDLNKALSEWKSGAAGRTRDISCPRMGLFRDERDTRSPWATKKDRTLEEIRSHYGLLLGVDDPLALSKFGNDREGMPFASGAFVACAVAAFKPKKVVGPLTVKLYHLAWLEHVVTDTLVNWVARKGRLSNSACGNAQVVDGLVILAREAVSNAIRIFKPKYDVASCSWTWGRHGLRLSSCGLEDLIPATAATRDGAEVQADEISGSLGGPDGGDYAGDGSDGGDYAGDGSDGGDYAGDGSDGGDYAGDGSDGGDYAGDGSDGGDYAGDGSDGGDYAGDGSDGGDYAGDGSDGGDYAGDGSDGGDYAGDGSDGGDYAGDGSDGGDYAGDGSNGGDYEEDPCIRDPRSTCGSNGGGSGNGSDSGEGNDVDSVDVSAILEEHNKARREVGVPDLAWDDGVAAAAQEWADHLASINCPLEHGLGQNLYWLSPAGLTSEEDRGAVQAWVDEKADWTPSPIPDGCVEGKKCGHYTQVVWRDTTHVGCASAQCPDGGGMWVCDYSPQGNIEGSMPY